MRRHHHVTTVISESEQFIKLIMGMPAMGVFCVDIGLPPDQLAEILQVFIAQSPTVTKVAIMLIGDITTLSDEKRQSITQLDIPIVALPLQEAPLLAAIALLEARLAAP